MNIVSVCRRAVTTAVLSVVASAALSAQSPVSPATFQIYQLGPSYAFYDTPGTYSTTFGSTTISTNPFTVISARSTGQPLGAVTSNTGFVNYFFMMQGAPGRVMASFTADMFVSLSNLALDENTLARATFTLSSSGTGRFYDPFGNVSNEGPSKDLRRSGPGTGRFNAPVDFTVDANAMYMVALSAGVSTGTPGLTGTAYLDPAITIGAAQASAYSLVLSAGISNLLPTTTTVPEPASVLLVGGGMVGIAAAVRRRRARAYPSGR